MIGHGGHHRGGGGGFRGGGGWVPWGYGFGVGPFELVEIDDIPLVDEQVQFVSEPEAEDKKRSTVVGLSWGDVEKAGRTAFPFIHTAGAAVLSAFGAGGLVAPIEQLERRGGLLPAPSKPSTPPDHIARGADFAVVIYKDGRAPVAVTRPDVVSVWGGRLFGGNGYAGPADYGSKFSFGYDAPQGVETVTQGRRAFFPDARQVLLCGGTAADKQNIQGEVMSKGIIGTILGALGLVPDDYQVGAHHIGAAPNKYFVGAVALATRKPPAAKPAAYGFQAKTTPKGRSFTSLVTNRSRKRDPQKTLTQLNAVSQRAQQIATTAVDRIAKAEVAAAKAARTPPKAALPPKKSIVGAVTPVKRVPRAAQMAAALPSLAQLKQKAVALNTAGVALKTHADKFKKTIDANATRIKSGTANAQKITRIHGYGFEDSNFHEVVGGLAIGYHGFGKKTWEEIGGWDEITAACDEADIEYIHHVVGWDEIIGATPDPNNPGYNLDGSLIQPAAGDVPDPTYPGFLTPSGAIDPNGQYAAYAHPAGAADAGAGGSLASGFAGPPDYGAGQPPVLQGNKIVLSDGSTWPQANVDFQPDPYPAGDDPTFYDAPTDDDLPLGAVIFDGSRAPAFMGLGNYSCFFDVVPGSPPPKGGPTSGYQLHDDGWWLLLAGTQPSSGYTGGRNFDRVNNPDTGMVSESKKNNWGPLMGNPKMYNPNTKSWGGRNWTSGLRFSPSGPNGPRWFWFYDQAPDWAVTGVLQAALNDQIAAYKAATVAGQTDYVNAQLQDKLNAQAAAVMSQQQAQQDAQLQMQQRAADAQNAIAQQQTDQQTQQLMLQQQAMQQQAYQQQAQLQAQAGAQMQQANQMQLDYFSQHPETMFASADETQSPPARPAGGGYGDDGYGGGDFGGGGVIDDAAINWGDASAQDGETNSEMDLTQEADDLFPSGG